MKGCQITKEVSKLLEKKEQSEYKLSSGLKVKCVSKPCDNVLSESDTSNLSSLEKSCDIQVEDTFHSPAVVCPIRVLDSQCLFYDHPVVLIPNSLQPVTKSSPSHAGTLPENFITATNPSLSPCASWLPHVLLTPPYPL